MPERDDLIRRADALPPPTIAEIALFHWIGIQVLKRPQDLEAWVARAQDKAIVAEVRRLHDQAENPAWAAAFIDAELRVSSVAEMFRREIEAQPPKKSRKRKKR